MEKAVRITEGPRKEVSLHLDAHARGQLEKLILNNFEYR
jgi:hypothetical protein